MTDPIDELTVPPKVSVVFNGKEMNVHLFQVLMDGTLWPSPSNVLTFEDPGDCETMFFRGPPTPEDVELLVKAIFDQVGVIPLFELHDPLDDTVVKQIFFTFPTLKKELLQKAPIKLVANFITECPMPSKFVDCHHCGQPVCHVMQYKDNFNNTYRQRVQELSGEDLSVDEFHKKIRYSMYKEYTSLEFGILGRGNRREPPVCIVDFVRNAAADPNNAYTGFIE